MPSPSWIKKCQHQHLHVSVPGLGVGVPETKAKQVLSVHPGRETQWSDRMLYRVQKRYKQGSVKPSERRRCVSCCKRWADVGQQIEGGLDWESIPGRRSKMNQVPMVWNSRTRLRNYKYLTLLDYEVREDAIKGKAEGRGPHMPHWTWAAFWENREHLKAEM